MLGARGERGRMKTTFTIDNAIARFEKVAANYKFNLDMHHRNVMKLSVNDIERMKEYIQENRQLAEWLRELKAYKDARVGCEYCEHKYREPYERPCSLCKRNFVDMFERANDEGSESE